MPVIYDLECRVGFGRTIEPGERRAFDQAAGVSHPGWHGPQTVVNWTGPEEATVFLVMRGPGPDEAPPQDTVCREAEARIRDWTSSAGLPGISAESVAVACEATARP